MFFDDSSDESGAEPGVTLPSAFRVKVARARVPEAVDGVLAESDGGRVGQSITKCPFCPQYLQAPSLSLRSFSVGRSFPSSPRRLEREEGVEDLPEAVDLDLAGTVVEVPDEDEADLGLASAEE